MGSYIPSSAQDQRDMLSFVGADNVDDLFRVIPPAVAFKGRLKLSAGKTEAEAAGYLRGLAAKNRVFGTVCRGAGAYRHYIPAIVKRIAQKEEFVTTYTPYQAEISQGVLQSIFEYQTMICELTGMKAANASVYDGATAAAEAVNMTRERKRRKALVSAAADPQTIATIKTYAFGLDSEVVLIPVRDGRTDLTALASLIDEECACVYLQQPNYYGLLEDAVACGELAHVNQLKFIMSCYPVALGLLATPAECGADIAVGEGQPLGMPLSFGGPYLGYMATTEKLGRKLPGRIVGETTDVDGAKAYVLTLQAREQHIRREKASSNICSNQALCAMTAAVYMSAMGPDGLAEVASQSLAKAHYAAAQIGAVAGFARVHGGEFFNEFVTACPVPTAQVLAALAEADILGGLPLAENRLLWCFTELNTKDEIDRVAAILEEVTADAADI